MERFFPVTVIGSRVFPWGLQEWRAWREEALHWMSAEEVETESRVGSMYDRVVRTEAELEAALREPTPGPPGYARVFWVQEALLPTIRRMWEAQRTPGRAE